MDLVDRAQGSKMALGTHYKDFAFENMAKTFTRNKTNYLKIEDIKLEINLNAHQHLTI